MTDKQIIIEKDIYTLTKADLVEQLARKTAEYKELEKYAQAQENQRETYYKEYLKLSQECEELKKEIINSVKRY